MFRLVYLAALWPSLLIVAYANDGSTGTFTFHTNVTTTSTISSTLTTTYTVLDAYDTITLTDPVTVTETDYGFTATSYYDTPRTQLSFITPTTTPTALVPTSTDFTPIRSAFPYTAANVVDSTVFTVTAYLSTEAFYISSTSTITDTESIVTVTVTSPAETGTTTTFNPVVSSLTFTSSAFAACATPANFVDKYPWGLNFGFHLGGLDGSIFAIDGAKVTRQTRSGVENAETCCNTCMSTGLCVGGFYSPLGLLGNTNECQIFLTGSNATCDGSRVDSEIAKTQFEYEGSGYSGYQLFNGQCGQTWPSEYDNLYYLSNLQPVSRRDVRMPPNFFVEESALYD